MTLVYPLTRSQILLGLKKQRIGSGTLVGFGGRQEPGENILVTATRELEEECGLVASLSALKPAGKLLITNPKYKELGTLEIHIFLLKIWQGEPVETEEMSPCWYHLEEMPWHNMRESERYWLPAVLKGHEVAVEITYDIEEQIQRFVLKIQK